MSKYKKSNISLRQFVNHVVCHDWILWLNGCLHSCYFLWECIQRVVSLEIVCGKVLSSQETSALCTWHTYNSGQILLTRTHLQIWKKNCYEEDDKVSKQNAAKQMTRMFQGHKCLCVDRFSEEILFNSSDFTQSEAFEYSFWKRIYIINLWNGRGKHLYFLEDWILCRRGICHGSHELRFCKII